MDEAKLARLATALEDRAAQRDHARRSYDSAVEADLDRLSDELQRASLAALQHLGWGPYRSVLQAARTLLATHGRELPEPASFLEVFDTRTGRALTEPLRPDMAEPVRRALEGSLRRELGLRAVER